ARLRIRHLDGPYGCPSDRVCLESADIRRMISDLDDEEHPPHDLARLFRTARVSGRVFLSRLPHE
ncbi:hypothetical protein ACQ7B2_23195, partial [Escherichia coli]